MNKNQITVIIVDDEEPARKLISRFLSDDESYKILSECADGFSAVKKINELKPNLVFLDIQMPKLNGLEVIELLDYMPMMIFITAFDEYAVKAFELNAVDYLMKPFSKSRFYSALNKIKEKINLKKDNEINFQKVKEIAEKNKKLERIAVKNKTNIDVINIELVSLFEAQDDYVQIYSQKGKYLKNLTMKYLEENLDENMFLRIHRSFIVNLNCIERIERAEKDNFYVILKNNAVAKASKMGIKILKDKLNL